MSVIARQGFKYSIIGYIGFLLGTLASIFLFPRNMEFYGKLRYLLSQSEILVPIVVFGISYSNVKFFRQVQKDGKHQNMLSVSLLAVVVNFLIFTLLYFGFYTLFPQYKTAELWKFRWTILPLILILSASAIFNKYLSNYKRIAVANIFENIFPKLANIAAFSLFFFFGASENASYALFISLFICALFGYGTYTNSLEKIRPDFSVAYFRENNFWKPFINYSFYGFLGNIGNYIAIRIDSIMISEFINFEENGVYSTLYAIISLISIPQMGLYNISAPVISKSLEENDFKELDRFHKKTSLTLFFLGAVLFCCILAGFPYLTYFIKNGNLLREAFPVVWILGSAILFDLATGFNGNIISLSKYYRYNIVIMLVLAILTFFLNYIFLKNTSLGIIGVSLATAISLVLYNITKIIFNYLKFRVLPLSFDMVYLSLFCTLAVTVATVLPDFKNNFLNLIYKPSVVLIIIFVANYYLKIFPVGEYLNRNFLTSLFGGKKKN